MKQEQKELIRSLRLQGWGYKRIAKELRLNRNQVQLYCKTHGLAGAGEFVKLNLPIWYEQNDRCIICGEKLDRKQRGRTKRFCSGKCRTKYYRAKKQDEDLNCPYPPNSEPSFSRILGRYFQSIWAELT